MTNWQEAYYDLVNKVECECVQQGDLVPIWEQFKRMALTIQKLQGNQAALEAEREADGRRIAELEGWKAAEEAHHHLLKQRIAALEAQLAEREHPQNHWTTKGAINAARKLIEVADALCFSAETACGTAGRDEHLCNAIEQWVAERDRQRQILRIIELEGHSPEIGAGILHPEARAMQGARDD